MTIFTRRDEWLDRNTTALSRALDDKARYRAALYELVVAVQVAHPEMVPGPLLSAETKAVAVLEEDGGQA